MPYLAWRNPLSALHFNAGMLRLLPYSTGCFDIALHFSVCLCAAFLSFCGESVRGSVRSGVVEYDLNLLTAPKDAPPSNSVWHWCFAGFRGISRHGKVKGRARVSPGLRVSGRREERRIGGFLWSPTLQIRGAERGSKWLVLCGGCDTLKSQSHLQHSFHQVH